MSTLLNPTTRSTQAKGSRSGDLLEGLPVQVEMPAALKRGHGIENADEEVVESADLAEVLDAFECAAGGGMDIAVELVNAPSPDPRADGHTAFRSSWWKKSWASAAFYTIGQPPRPRAL